MPRKDKPSHSFLLFAEKEFTTHFTIKIVTSKKKIDVQQQQQQQPKVDIQSVKRMWPFLLSLRPATDFVYDLK